MEDIVAGFTSLMRGALHGDSLNVNVPITSYYARVAYYLGNVRRSRSHPLLPR